MWQRKQTVFLSIAIFCLIMMIFFPVWKAQLDQTSWALYPLQLTVQQSSTGTSADKVVSYFPYAVSAILAIAAATIAFIEIGKYENRLLQLKLGALNSLFMAGSMGTAVVFATQLMKQHQVVGEYGYALYLPAVAMICNLIANRFIRRDEKLVRDSDRLR